MEQISLDFEKLRSVLGLPPADGRAPLNVVSPADFVDESFNLRTEPLMTPLELDNVNYLRSLSTSRTEHSPLKLDQAVWEQGASWPVVNGVPVFAMGLQTTVLHVVNDNSDRILVIRRIHRLGFNGPEEFIRHFQKLCGCGCIECVILLPSRRKLGKLRPSSTGFLVCKDAEAAKNILELGTRKAPEQPLTIEIKQCSIEIAEFEYPDQIAKKKKSAEENILKAQAELSPFLFPQSYKSLRQNVFGGLLLA